MAPTDALSVIAEISLGLAGFTAVVSVLRRPGGQLEGIDLYRSVHLLAYSGATMVLALLPYVLQAIGSTSATTWRVSSVAMIGCSLAGMIDSPIRREAMPGVGAKVSRTLIRALWGFALGNVALQALNASGVFAFPSFWPFLLGLLWYIAYCLFQFAGLLFLRPGGSPPAA